MAHRVIPLINAARTNPDKTGDSLNQNLKTTFKDNQMNAFGKRVETFEGVKALKDLHQYLRNLAPTSNLLQSPVLNRAAEQIAKQKGIKGDVTQQKPRVINQKISKTGKIVGKVGELICVSTETAEESAAYFLIDDGLVSRKRRRMLLDPSYKYIGAGEAKHSQYGSILVILLAESITE